MNVYIDLPNLRSFAKSCAGHPDCKGFLRQNFNLLFTFDKECIDREKKESRLSIMNFFKTLAIDRNTNVIKWGVTPPDITNITNAPIDDITSVYWQEQENAAAEQSKGCLLISPVGGEVKTLLNFFIENNPIPTKEYRTRKMTDWSVIENNASPCTDIVIVDPYFFAQSELLYKYNSYKIIEHLTKNAKNEKVNIVIFSFNKYPDEDKSYEVPFPTIERQLKELLEENIGEKPNITFVILPKRKEHDRNIYTNYKSFSSGDSFKYFDAKGAFVSRGKNFYVKSHADKDNQDSFKEAISDLQSLVDSLKGGLASIQGDQVSNFIKFT